MPRLVSDLLLRAKREGWPKCNVLHLAQEEPRFLTDNAWDVEHNGDLYKADGLLLKVDPGTMSAGEANDWTFEVSAVDPAAYNFFLGQEYVNRWVYHYKVYFQDTRDGYFKISDVESKKFGRILSAKTKSSNQTAVIRFTVTSPNGDEDDQKVVQTNSSSQKRFFGVDDTIMQHAHETAYEVAIPASTTGTVKNIQGYDIP
ncbi:MAG: hypothetical protein V7733_16365 [Paraglaciecola polaris]|uniref:hypothetical protein n=1 Tax=Paraglaciecola polaris TaxID=222814 RepID=UPI0030036658